MFGGVFKWLDVVFKILKRLLFYAATRDTDCKKKMQYGFGIQSEGL